MAHVLYKTSVNDSIATPPAIYSALDAIFHFDYDPCPLVPTFDGLADDNHWGQSNFVNPPFSHIKKWVQKAVSLPDPTQLTLFLLPARTQTQYWREFVWPSARRLYFFQKGFPFVGYTKSFAPPIVLVLFGGAHIPDSELPVISEVAGLPIVTVHGWQNRRLL